MQDIRYAFRSLRKQPIFTLIAVLTLTLGIGANTAIFSLVYQILLRPLPYPDAERLVFVWNSYPLMGLDKASVSIPDYLDRRTQAPAFEDATLFTGRALNLRRGGEAEQIRALAVTPSFFTHASAPAGARARLHRGRSEAGRRQAGDPDARRSGARASAATRRSSAATSAMNGEAYKVVGVLPRRLRAAGAGHRRARAVRVHPAADDRQRRAATSSAR